MGFHYVIANSIFELGLCPIFTLDQEEPGKDFKIPYNEWPKLIEHSKVKSLRSIARDYGVSHEAVRRVLDATSQA